MENNRIQLHAWGQYALFTRPELKVERLSYDVMTPSAARGILEAIHWKPAIEWIIERIRVLNPIRFEAVQRNEVSRLIPIQTSRAAMRSGNSDDLGIVAEEVRQQRSSVILRDVGYVITARIELTGKTPGDHIKKHHEMFTKRARLGQCFHRPYLGTREFAADFELVENAEPASRLPAGASDRELGLMFYDFNYKSDRRIPRFFRARMENGVINVPDPTSPAVKS